MIPNYLFIDTYYARLMENTSKPVTPVTTMCDAEAM